MKVSEMKTNNKKRNNKINKKNITFIDGYNVINSVFELKEASYLNLENARDKLNEMMHEYANFYGEEVTIVYDAYNRNKNISNKYKHHNINVVYTKKNQTADSYIEKEVSKLVKDVRLLIRVVTNDYTVQKYIFSAGAIRMTNTELLLKYRRISEIVSDKYLN